MSVSMIGQNAEPDFEKMQEKLNELHAAQFVPGVMCCAKCKFELIRTTLHVNDGTTSAGNSDTEPCPNGCGPLWPVTWRKYAKDRIEGYDELLDHKNEEIAGLRHRLTLLNETFDLAMKKILDSSAACDNEYLSKAFLELHKMIEAFHQIANGRIPEGTIEQ